MLMPVVMSEEVRQEPDIKALTKGEKKMYKYRLDFELSEPLRDESFYEAQDYLHDFDMTQYFVCEYRSPEQQALKDVLAHVEWDLDNLSEGHVDIITSSPLSDKQIAMIYDEICGQNSDGLGEGFEQQDFACWTETEESGEGYYEEIREGYYEWIDDDEIEINHMSSLVNEKSIELIETNYPKNLIYDKYHHVDVNLSDLIYDNKPIDFSKDDNVINQRLNTKDIKGNER